MCAGATLVRIANSTRRPYTPIVPSAKESGLAKERPYSRDFVNSIARALRVVRCFDERHAELSLSEVATRAELTRATARRILLTLVELGYARFDGRRFGLTPRVLGLGYAYLSSRGLADLARPYAEQASRLANESCSLSVLSGSDIVYVCRVHTERIMSISLGVGTQLPAHVTSMGRVLLAHLPDEELESRLGALTLQRFTPRTVTSLRRLRGILTEVREHGWAFVEEELEVGLSSLAVPVRDGHGEVIAALNLGGSAARIQGAAVRRRYLPILTAAAASIHDALQQSSFSRRAAVGAP
jgi:IclR family transcriptional regulator, pca regulon regulatory protein